MNLVQSGFFWLLLSLMMLGVSLYLARPFFQTSKLLQASKTSNPRLSLLTLIGFLPLAALGIYLFLGSPSHLDQPLGARLDRPLEELPPAAIIAKLEARLRDNPTDSEGWRILARMRGRTNDLARNLARAGDAWRRVLELKKTDIEALTSLASVMIEQEEGGVSQAAQSLIEQALETHPDDARALYLVGLSDLQAGRQDAARRHWTASRDTAEKASPWHQFMSAQLARIPQ